MSRIGRFNRVKTSTLPKLTCRFNTIPIKIPARVFVDIDKIILKLIWKIKGTRIAKIMWKRIKCKESIYPISRLINIATVNKLGGTDVRIGTQVDEQKTELRNRPTQTCQMILHKNAKAIQWRKDNFFNKRCWSSWTSIAKKSLWSKSHIL